MLTNDHHRFDYAVMYITDYHREYAIPELPDRPRLRVFQVWSQYDVSNLLSAFRDDVKTMDDEDAMMAPIIEVMKKCLPEELHEAGIDGNIHYLQGPYDDLLALFRAFYQSVMSNPTGGDCDTFDYWPNAMEMCEQIAADLDTWKSTTAHRDELRTAYLAFIAPDGVNAGPVMEYHFDGYDKPLPGEDAER